MPEARRLCMLARIEEMPQTSRPVASRPVQPVDAAALFTWWDGLPFLAFCLTQPRLQGRGLATALIADGEPV